MFFVENERAGGNWFKSFDTVDSDKARIKAQPPILTTCCKDSSGPYDYLTVTTLDGWA